MANRIELIPQIPDGLREAAQAGRLIPFIGAGVSRIAGCPGWQQFADGALRCLVDAGKFSHGQLAQINNLNPRVKLSIALRLQNELQTRIDFHKLLHPNGVREDAKGRKLYASVSRLGKRFVIHLHGSVQEPASMILTTQDYLRHYANDRFSGDPEKENRILTFLEYLFKERTVLFIGYGLEELEILEYVILKARGIQGNVPDVRHYLLQGFFSHEYELMRSLTDYYLECGIKLIPYLRDNKDWDQLLDVLDEFARLMPASEPMVLEQLKEMGDLLNG